MFDLTKCDICPNECGVDRRKVRGLCSAKDKMIIAGYSLHFFEEPCVSGTNGSGTVFFSGCGMRCVYCQNYRISRPFLSENDDKNPSISSPFLPKNNEKNAPFLLENNGKNTSFLSRFSLENDEKNARNLHKNNEKNTRISKARKQLKGYEITPAELSDIFKKLEDLGAHNINLVSPTHFAPLIISAIQKYKPKIPIIYNTSGYEKRESISRLNDYIDVYLTDLKYADLDAIRTLQNRPNGIMYDIANDINNNIASNIINDTTNDIINVIKNDADFSVAKKLSGRSDYTLYAVPAIAEMIKGKGKPVIENGLIKSGVIIRHLILPSYLENSLRVLELVAKNFKDDAIISIMSQYTPLEELRLDKKINRPLKPIEYKIVLKKALDLGINDAYIQEQTSCGKEFIPDYILH
jgi:putative pyruvate formate lyase activating enzyme